jgi:hypothetical protein
MISKMDRSSSSNEGIKSIDAITNVDMSPHAPGYADKTNRSPPPSRRLSIRPQNLQISSSLSTLDQQQPMVNPRRSKLASPVFTSLREKDDPYFLALPDSSRTKILSNSAPDLNTLPHPPPRAHRRPNRDSTIANGNGRLMEQLHSSRRHSTLGVTIPAPSSFADIRPLTRRASAKIPFRLQRHSPPHSGSSSPNYGSDSESEIFDDDHSSNVGSAVSTRPSSFSSTASFSETFLRSSASTSNLDNKVWKRGSLAPSFSNLDLRKKRDANLPERDYIEIEECRFLEAECQRYLILWT